jgi:hypothetical protein
MLGGVIQVGGNGGPGGALVGAQNGLNVPVLPGSIVELGGVLIKDTVIDGALGAFYLAGQNLPFGIIGDQGTAPALGAGRRFFISPAQSTLLLGLALTNEWDAISAVFSQLIGVSVRAGAGTAFARIQGNSMNYGAATVQFVDAVGNQHNFTDVLAFCDINGITLSNHAGRSLSFSRVNVQNGIISGAFLSAIGQELDIQDSPYTIVHGNKIDVANSILSYVQGEDLVVNGSNVFVYSPGQTNTVNSSRAIIFDFRGLTSFVADNLLYIRFQDVTPFISGSEETGTGRKVLAVGRNYTGFAGAKIEIPGSDTDQAIFNIDTASSSLKASPVNGDIDADPVNLRYTRQGVTKNFAFCGGRVVANVAEALSVMDIDNLIIQMNNPAARTVQLPPIIAGIEFKPVWIKDGAGTAGAANIVVNPVIGDTIDGAASYAIAANYAVYGFYTDGFNWFRI